MTLRPGIEAAAADVVASPAFAVAFGAGMRALHRGVFSGSSGRPSLRIPGMAAQVQAALALRTPVLATRLPQRRGTVADVDRRCEQGAALLRAAPAGDGLARAAPIVLVVGLLGLLLAVVAARDRRRGVWAGRLALAGVGAALALAGSALAR